MIFLIYLINGENFINLFGSIFVENNKNICKMIIDNMEYKLAEKYNILNQWRKFY